MATIKVHGSPLSTATMRVTATLYEKQLEFEFVPINMGTGEHKKQPFISLNPFGQLPAFEDGDLKLFESRAITQYIVHEYGDKGTQLISSDSETMAITGVWLEVEGQHYEQPASTLVWELGIKPMFGFPTDPAVVEENEVKLGTVLDVYEKRLSGEMGDAHMAMQARLMSQALRKLCHSLSLSQCILIFINQVRSKISTFGGFGGPTEVTCGGNALKFYSSVRLNIKRVGLVKKGEETLGSQVLVKIVKNKLAPPFKTAQFELQFGKGICKEAEIIELSLKYKLIKKSGAFYEYNGRNFHGKDALKRFLAEGDVAQELTTKLREKLLNDEAEIAPEGQVIGDVTEEMVLPDSTDEGAAAAVEA